MATEELLTQQTQDVLGLAKEEPIPFVTTVPEATVNAELEKARLADKESGFLTGFSTGVQEEHIGNTISRNLYRFSDNPAQPVAEITPEISKMLSEGLTDPQAIEDVFEAAKSNGLSYAAQMAADYRITEQNMARLAQSGWTGKTGYVLAAMLDPTEIAATAATTAAVSAIATPASAPVTAAGVTAAKTAQKGYNVWKATKLGFAVGAAEAAAFESIRARLKYDVSGGDVLLAMLTAGTINSAISGTTVKLMRTKKLHEIDQKLALGETLSPAERALYDQFGGDQRVNQLIEDAERRGDFEDPNDTPLAEPFSEAEARATTKQLGIGAKVRGKLSSFVRAKNSDNAYTRLGADKLGLNSTGNRADVDGNRAAVNFSSSEIKSMLEFRYRTAFARTLHKNRKEWMRSTGGGVEDFNILVSKAIRTGDLDNVPPQVRKVAEDVMKAERQLGEMAIKYDVAGYTSGILDRQPNYLPRLFKDEKIQAIKTKHGVERTQELVAELVEKAVRKAQPEIGRTMKAEQITRMARGYARTILNPQFHNGHRSMEFNMEDLRKSLGDEGFTPEEIDEVVDNLTRSTTVKAHKRARPRLLLDENTSIEFKNSQGNIETLTFTDLLEEDIENLHNAYVFQMAGAIGLARNGINTNQVGSSFDNLISKIKAEASETGQTTKSMDDDVQALQFMYDGITGRLGFEEGMTLGSKQFLRRMREYNFISIMGMTGFAAVMELTNALLEYSIPVLFRSMPHLRRFNTKLVNGQLEDNLLREMEELTGLGGDVITGKFARVSRFEGDTMEVVPDSNITKVDELLGRGREATAFLSGLTPVTAGLRRLSMLNYANSWSRAAQKGDNPFAQIKMEQLGISTARVNGKPSMADRIAAQVKKHATYSNRDRTVLDSLNTKDWDDAEALETFTMSAFREGTSNVQEMNIGSSNRFLRSEVGKTMFQFLSFPLAALEQQTMRLGVRMMNGDASTVAKVMLGSVLMGYLTYSTRVYLNAQGRGDKEEYIKKMMSPEMLVEGTLSQVGAASFFGYLYQVHSGAMEGNTFALTPASITMAQGFLKAAGVPLDAVFGEDGDVSEAELRQALRLLPFASLLGAKQLINGVADQFTITN